MIKDKLENAQIYYGISERLKEGFIWLKSQNLKTIEPNKYQLSNDLYANVQQYLTKDNAKYEAHRKYIDIQYMITGNEEVGYCSKDDCCSYTEYNSESDLEFLECNNNENRQILNEGEFMVFFPNDAHKPSIKNGNNAVVKKVVVKVPVD